MYARAELASLRANLERDNEALARTLSELLGRLETARFLRPDLPPAHRRTLAARRTLARRLASALSHVRRFDAAEAALRVAWESHPDPEGSCELLMEVAAVASLQGRWTEAERLLLRVEEVADREGAPGFAVHALGRRALMWIRRGLPLRADALLARAEAHPGQSADMEEFLAYVRAFRGAAVGDAEPVRAWGRRKTRVDVPLDQALLAVADAIAARTRGEDPGPAVERVRALVDALAEGNPAYPIEVERLLVHAGVVRPDEIVGARRAAS
jgi:hypothetical protein